MNELPDWLQNLVVFDTETTGLDLREARIVTAAVAKLDTSGNLVGEAQEWLADPGIPIPVAASNVHGITTEIAQAQGADAKQVIGEILHELRAAFAAGIPVVAYNAPYDFTILHFEALRHGFDPIQELFPILDPLVLDKKFDQYRSGKRTLSHACEFYGVRLDDAHTATADAVAAGRVLLAIARKFPEGFAPGALNLHQSQVAWSDEQSESFANWMRGQGKPDFRAQLGWPRKLK